MHDEIVESVGIDSIDVEALARDLDALRAEIDASLGPEDLEHLLKIERWGRRCAALGYATAWIAPNLVSWSRSASRPASTSPSKT